MVHLNFLHSTFLDLKLIKDFFLAFIPDFYHLITVCIYLLCQLITKLFNELKFAVHFYQHV